MGAATPTRKRRRVEEEEHENHERWLVSYADMITVLMILFIVLFAMSQIDVTKFNALRAGLAAGFGQAESLLDGSASLMPEPGTQTAGDIAPASSSSLTPEQQAAVDDAVRTLQAQQGQRAAAEGTAELSRLLDVLKRVDAALRAAGLRDDVVASIDRRGLVLSLVSRHVVFGLGQADLTPLGRQVVDTIAPVLAELPDPIELDGHTNQQKFAISDPWAQSEANWSLASNRAITVLNYLYLQHGFPETRLSTAAFGDTRPLVDPKQAGSQEVNKRVDIVVMTQLPAESRAALEQAAAEYGATVNLDSDLAAAPAPTTTTNITTAQPKE